MAWMLWIVDQLCQVDVIKLVLMGAKSGGSTLATYLLKKIWSRIMIPQMNKCRIGLCNNFKQEGMKGLCPKCYKQAKRKVELGETTWEELASLGLCESEGDPFSQAFNKAKKGD